jgi:hypothetical protein
MITARTSVDNPALLPELPKLDPSTAVDVRAQVYVDDSTQNEPPLQLNAFSRECLSVSKDTFGSLANPEHSIFLQGLKLFFCPRQGGYMGSGYDSGMGFLFLCASPVAEPLHKGGCLVVGTGSLLAGAVSSVLSVSQWLLRKAVVTVREFGRPAEETLFRTYVAKLFCERVYDISTRFRGISVVQVRAMQRKPDLLVACGILSVAFFSRNEPRGRLRMADESIVDLDQVGDLPSVAVGYFQRLHQLKEFVSRLELPTDDQEAWATVVEYVHVLFLKLEAQNADPNDSTTYDPTDDLVFLARELASMVVDDPDFKREWALLLSQRGVPALENSK